MTWLDALRRAWYEKEIRLWEQTIAAEIMRHVAFDRRIREMKEQRDNYRRKLDRLESLK